MIITTTDSIPGKEIHQIIGIVVGNTVQAKHIGRDIMAGLKTIIGGEIKGYTEMMTEARSRAHERMEDNARDMGADAVLNCRYTTSMVSQGMSEILAYGTAVKIS